MIFLKVGKGKLKINNEKLVAVQIPYQGKRKCKHGRIIFPRDC